MEIFHFHSNGYCATDLAMMERPSKGNSEMRYCEAVKGFGLTPNICPQIIFVLFAAVYKIKQ